MSLAARQRNLERRLRERRYPNHILAIENPQIAKLPITVNAPILFYKEENHGKNGDRLKNNTQMAPCTLRILTGLRRMHHHHYLNIILECLVAGYKPHQYYPAHNHNINIQQDTFFKLTFNLFSMSISSIYMLQLMRFLLDSQSDNLLCPIH